MSIALIIAADEPAVFYNNIESAELDLEAIDVERGVYTAAFGPRGEKYDIASTGGRVRIARQPSMDESPEDLKKVLLEFLSAMNIDVDDKARLSYLLDKCEPYVE